MRTAGAGRRARRRLVPGVLLTLGTAFACTAPAPAPQPPIRWIADEAPDALTPEALFGRQVAFAWDLADEGERARWTGYGAMAPLRANRWGVALPQGQSASLSRDAGFPASAVHAVEVAVRSASRIPVRLSWRRAGEEFAPERSITVTREEGAAAPDRVVAFDVRSHPQWTGHVATLALDIGGIEVDERTLTAVRGIGHPASHASVLAAARRPWRATVGAETRTVLLVPDGAPASWEGVVPTEAELRLGVAVTTPLPAPATLQVVALQDAVERTLSTVDIAPGAAAWRDVSTDLGPLAGRHVRLEIRGGLPAGWDPLAGLPVAANPVIVSRRHATERAGVVLVSIDALRPDRLSAYGHARQTSPALDRWAAARACRFDRAVAQATWTLPSHASLLTGIDAIRHGLNQPFTSAPPSIVTLAEMLRSRGYATAAVTGGGWLHPAYGLDQGFDVFRFLPAEQGGAARELDESLARAASLLQALPRPFFLFLHTYAVHDFQRDASATSLDRLGDLYDDAIASVDAKLGPFLEKLGAEPTLVVVTSDHGEALGEDGVVGHGKLHASNLFVPLFVALPDGRTGGRSVARQVRSIDVVPTILEALAIPLPAGIDGRSLLPLVDGRRADLPPAATYAATADSGLSLRTETLSYVVDDAGFAPASGKETIVSLRPPPDGASPSRFAAEVDALRRTARSMLTSAPGVRLRIANAGTAPVLAEVRGAWVTHTSVRSLDLPCPCTALTAGDELQVTVPPGCGVALNLGTPRGDVARVALLADGALERRAMRVADLPQTLVLRHGAWSTDAAGAAPDAIVDVAWHGSETGDVRGVTAGTAELWDRLHRLGYVQ